MRVRSECARVLFVGAVPGGQLGTGGIEATQSASIGQDSKDSSIIDASNC
jgi:hypothetical protein